MKFRKLQIDNLASIEHAVVDFEGEPLVHENIFLICGETGAGKSTILDAICLALYKDSPRFASAPNTRISLGENEIQNKDVSQILRENTLEGAAALEFTGNDGIAYTAVWRVWKPGRDLERKPKTSWALSWFEDGREIVLTKVSEITDRIYLAVGLTFGQFCRTSMLAQGEFTRFLKSNDKEKAEILEKLTDTGDYVELGKRIFERTREKKAECALLEMEMQGIRLLSDEEEENLEQVSERLGDKVRLMDSYIQGLDQGVQWIEDKEEKDRLWEEARKDLAKTSESLGSTTYRDRKLLVRQWQESSQARMNRKDWLECRETLGQMEKEKGRLIHEMETYRSGFLFLLERRKDLKEEKEKLAQQEAECLPGLRVYENAQMYLEWLNQLEVGRSRAGVLLSRISKGQKMLDEESVKLKQIEAGRDRKASELQSLEGLLRGLQAEMELFPMARLQMQQASLLESLARWQQVEGLYHDCLKKKEYAGNVRKEKENSLQLLSETGKVLENATTSRDHAIVVFEEEQSRVNKLIDSVSEGAKVLRSRLQPGGTCPVCGQKVEKQVLDSIFEEVYHRMEVVLDEKRRQRDLSVSAWQQAQVEMEKVRVSTEQKILALEQATGALEDAMSELGQGLKVLGVCVQWQEGLVQDDRESLEDIVGNRLDWTSLEKQILQGKAACEAESDSLKRKIGQADRLGREYQQTLIIRNECSENLGKLEQDMVAAKTRMKSYREALEQLVCDRNDTEKEVRNLEEQLDIGLQPPGWNRLSGWKEQSLADMSGLKGHITELTLTWKSLQDRKTTLEVWMGKVEDELVRVRELLSGLPDEIDWHLESPIDGLTSADGKGIEVENLSSRLLDFVHRFNRLLSLISETDRRAKDLSGKLDSYLAGHPDMSLVQLDRLLELTDIGQMQQYCEDLEHQFAMAGNSFRNRSLDRERHLQACPRFDTLLGNIFGLGRREDGATGGILYKEEDIPLVDGIPVKARLVRLKDGLRKFRDETQVRLGEIGTELRKNGEARQTLGVKKKEWDARWMEYTRWERLNKMFGDAQGAGFQLIAQSFIMHELLFYANGYLRMLSDRYSLECSPGTLTLMVRDLKDGGSLRSCSGLSGGESFQVSLALALGLSGFGGTRTGCDILFIDEGFGTLSGEPLNLAVDTLARLQQQDGRRVGIISHVVSLRERIPTQIRVEKVNPTRSQVKVVRV